MRPHSVVEQIALCLIAIALSSCVSNARYEDMREKLDHAEKRLEEQQNYVAATQDRDAQMQSDMQDAYQEMQDVWGDQVDELKAQAKTWAKRNCGT